MTWRKCMLVVAVLLLFGYVVHRGARRGSDFKYPYGAAQALWRTGRLHVDAQPRYPITFHVLLAPLASLPIGTAAAVWAALSFGAVAILPRLLGELSGLTRRQQRLAWLIVLPCAIDALVLGQSDPINLALVSAGLVAARRGRPGAGAGLIGIAGMIKILPLVHWGTLAVRCRSRGALAGMALAALGGAGLVVAAVGSDAALAGIQQQVRWISEHEKPWHLVARGSDLRANNESLPIVLARTLGDLGPVRPRHALSLGLLSHAAIWRLWGGILVVLAITWLFSARTALEYGSDRASLGMFALTSILMLAASPICWPHYFLWTLPALLFLNERRRLLFAALAISLVGFALPAARGLGGHMFLALGLFGVVARDMRALAYCPTQNEGNRNRPKVWRVSEGVNPAAATP